MKGLGFILLVLNSWAALAQTDLQFPLKSEFSWKDVEKTNHPLKTKFVNNLPEDLEYFRATADYQTQLDKSLHVMDFNNDGLDDIVFDGWGGAEPDVISIYINNGKSFDKVFSAWQAIFKMEFEDKKVVKLYIQDWGCCCEIRSVNKVFTVRYQSKIPIVELSTQMQFLSNSELPENYFDKPVKFQVINNDYNIRFAPVKNDSTDVYYCGEPRKGNGVGKIQSGTVGYGLAQKSDSTGRVWWFVAIAPETEIKGSMFFDSKEEPPSYKLGWISSRYIKKVEE